MHRQKQTDRQTDGNSGTETEIQGQTDRQTERQKYLVALLRWCIIVQCLKIYV